MRQTISINEIIVETQPRKDFGDIASLAESIRERGLLQPLVLDTNKLLICGERRYRACKLLGMESVDYVDIKEMTTDEREEIQLIENNERQDLSWQERALSLLSIWRKKRQRGVLEGWTWGVREASVMFKMSVGSVDYVLKVARKLEAELSLPVDQRKYHSYSSAAEAYRLGILQEVEDSLLAESANRARITTNQTKNEIPQAVIEATTAANSDPSLLEAQRDRYYKNPLNTVPFETYWKQRTEEIDRVQNTIHLSNIIVQGDCIEFMNSDENVGRFDHIITDPPYAIDMDNLQQENVGMNVDSVVDAHHVDENKELLVKFFPAAFKCTKPSAFVITCCDAMLWQFMYDLAIKAGFAVQRWPIIWRKVNQSVMNNCSQYNTTKDYEIIMVCRKPSTTISTPLNTSIIDASNSEVKKITGHPFAKPFELTRKLIQTFTLEGQLILEPFAGGGSMAIEILRQKRNLIAVEKETHHYNSLLENVKQHHFLKLNPKFIFS